MEDTKGAKAGFNWIINRTAHDEKYVFLQINHKHKTTSKKHSIIAWRK